MNGAPPAIVLASGSAARRRLLAAAGVAVVARAPGVDEAAIKAAMAGAPPEALALALARRKALAVLAETPEALVIGADQVLECAGQVFDKPESLAAAAAQLARLQGRAHRLFTAVALAGRGGVLWDHVDVARLAMRALDADAITAYLARAGAEVLGAVGAYHVEGLGIQLFEAIDGDLFAVQGLPLLPLLGALRRHGGVP